MADNVTANAGSGGATFRSDDVGGVQVPFAKLDAGGDGLSVPLIAGQQLAAASLPVVLASDWAPGTAAANLAKAEDAVHASGDVGVMALAVRADTPAATAAAGDYTPLLTDAAGRLWVHGQVAHDSVVGGAPFRIGGHALTADQTAVASNDVTNLIATILGKLVVMPYALPGQKWRYAAAAGGLVTTSGVTAKAAAGAGVKNFITSIQIINTHPTISTEVEIRDGAAGTVMFRGWAQAAGGGLTTPIPVALEGSANTLVEIAEVTATATTGVLVNLQGYTGAE